MFVFIHYVKLSHPVVIAVMAMGVVSIAVSVAVALTRSPGRRKALPLILGAVTILMGMAGSALNASGINKAALVEAGAGIAPSASQYYSSECGYNETLFYVFPFIVGVASALPAIVTGIIIMARKD